MAHFITIAGPMSSGKTRVMEHLKKRYKSWIFVDEINPRTVTKNNLVGAVQTSSDLEKMVCEMDLKVLRIINKNRNVFVETGIFHFAYALHFFSLKDQKLFFQKYLDVYKKMPSSVVFIDAKPHVSWKRRKPRYIERIKKLGIKNKKDINKELLKYKKIIYEMYPHWVKCYNKIPFAKTIIKNSYKSEKVFLKEVDKVILSLISRKSPQ